MERHGRFYKSKPKTREPRRRITWRPTVATALRRAIEGRTSENLVFAAPRGGRLDQGNWYESRWQRAIKEGQEKGLTKTRRFHDLRHSNAAWFVVGVRAAVGVCGLRTHTPSGSTRPSRAG